MNEYELIRLYHVISTKSFNFYRNTLQFGKGRKYRCFLDLLFCCFELKISFTSSMIKTVTPISISPMNSKTYSRIQIETALRLSPLRICGGTLFLDSTCQHTRIAVWTNVYRGEDYPTLLAPRVSDWGRSNILCAYLSSWNY